MLNIIIQHTFQQISIITENKNVRDISNVIFLNRYSWEIYEFSKDREIFVFELSCLVFKKFRNYFLAVKIFSHFKCLKNEFKTLCLNMIKKKFSCLRVFLSQVRVRFRVHSKILQESVNLLDFKKRFCQEGLAN